MSKLKTYKQQEETASENKQFSIKLKPKLMN